MLLRHINYFLAVADQQSFTRAAATLYVSQPALSQQIKQLEEELDCLLFDRTGRNIRLTDAGQVYARYARLALLNLKEGRRAIHDVQNLSSGTLRIATTPTFTTYLVGPLVKIFHKLYPNISLSVQEMSQERMEERLLEDEFDVGIAFADVKSVEIESQMLLRESLALVVGQHHVLANKQYISLQTLSSQPLMLLTNEFATRAQIERYCHQYEVRPRVLMEANSLSAVIEVVRQTELATLLPSNIASVHADLVAIPLTPSILQRTAVLMQRKGVYQIAAAQEFIALAHKHCQKHHSV